MIGRMIRHGIAAALVVGTLAFAWQAFAFGGATKAVAGLVAGSDRDHRHDD